MDSKYKKAILLVFIILLVLVLSGCQIDRKSVV